MLELLIGVGAGAVALWVFYQALKIDWPEHYFGATDFSAYAISASPFHYAVFRFVPVFVVCVFVAVTLERRGSPFVTLSALLIGAIHGSLTLGNALVGWMRSEPTAKQRWAAITIVRVIALAGVMGTAYAASAFRDTFAPSIPQLHELSASLWTAGFAGIAAAFVLRVARDYGLGDGVLLRRSLRQLPPALTLRASEAASKHAADQTLVLAVMTVENLQRPPWFRSLERLKARISPSGTYGIMQVAAAKQLSDLESVDLAVSERFAHVNVRDAKGALDYKALLAFGASYNASPTFPGLLFQAWVAVSERTPQPVSSP